MNHMNSPVILITGAGKGIGKAVVEAVMKLASQKAPNLPQIMLTSRTLSDLEDLQLRAKKAGLTTSLCPDCIRIVIQST